MTTTAVHHATFTLERDFGVSPSRLWGAFAREELKGRWFGAQHEQYAVVERSFDFRPGGRERLIGKWHNGTISDFQCQYFDIVDGSRMNYVYEMVINGWKMSVSLATIEVVSHGAGSRLRITEQGAFFGDEGAKNAAGREQGTSGLLEILGASLSEPGATVPGIPT